MLCDESGQEQRSNGSGGLSLKTKIQLFGVMFVLVHSVVRHGMD